MIVNKIKHLLQPQEWRDEIGGDYISNIIKNRRAYAYSLNEWKTQAPPLPIDGFPGSPINRNKNELISYLEKQGVKHV
jgi:hypothetical protein